MNYFKGETPHQSAAKELDFPPAEVSFRVIPTDLGTQHQLCAFVRTKNLVNTSMPIRLHIKDNEFLMKCHLEPELRLQDEEEEKQGNENESLY